jgi:pimeloyl-ACP methyl ester carboxylesterase
VPAAVRGRAGQAPPLNGIAPVHSAAVTGLLIVALTARLAWEMRHPPRHTAGYAAARGLAGDPGELGLPFEEWALERPDGANLPVWEIANRSSSIDHPLTAVFVHGWGHSRIDALARVAPPDSPFRAMCGRMVFYDLRGHGESGGATSRLGDGEADDLRALLERLGDGPIVLVGHSMGAVMAIEAAGLQESSPSTSHHVAPGESPAAQCRPIAGVIAYGPYVDFHRSLRGRLGAAGLPTRPITDLAMLVHRAMGLRPRGVSIEAIKRLPCPMLIFQGSEDCVAPPEEARMIAEAAPDARLIEIPGADHLNAHEVDRARHDAAVGEFLKCIGGQ